MMLPYWRAFIYSFLTRGIGATLLFFEEHKLPPLRNEDAVALASKFYRILTPEEFDFLNKIPLHMRNKWGPKIKAINDRIQANFFFYLRPASFGPFFSRQVERILRNREMRIFIEILSLAGEEAEVISELLPLRFKLKTPISGNDIEEYKFWFFDVDEMDDIDWQNYLDRFPPPNTTKDLVFEAEREDKFFALRHNKNHVYCRLGLQNNMGLEPMLSFLKNSLYDRLVSDIEDGRDIDSLGKQINTFMRLGAETEKMKSSGAGEHLAIFSGKEMYLQTTNLDSIPFLGEDYQLVYDGTKEDNSR